MDDHRPALTDIEERAGRWGWHFTASATLAAAVGAMLMLTSALRWKA
jgi:hypothetical protein